MPPAFEEERKADTFLGAIRNGNKKKPKDGQSFFSIISN